MHHSNSNHIACKVIYVWQPPILQAFSHTAKVKLFKGLAHLGVELSFMYTDHTAKVTLVMSLATEGVR